MGQEIIEAPKVVEGEVLTDKPMDAGTEKLISLLCSCEDALETILELAQRIDHGMTDIKPNKPNREIVRIADEAVRLLHEAHAAADAAELGNDGVTLLEGEKDA